MRLSGVSYRSGSQLWLSEIDLTLVPGEMNVVLGASNAGKTTLLRILAGLEQPTTGRLLDGEQDLTGVALRRRNVAMVYQQFINYPSLTVYENIAAPLRIAGASKSLLHARVMQLAETLQLSACLWRYPAELSGGQQQRTALARALAKDARLILLDEPLVNLDYKLREALRTELAQLFAKKGTTVVYATAEPHEALQLGGHLTLLAEGRVLQSGPTLQVYRRPATLAAARACSDPPFNVLPARLDSARHEAVFAGAVRLALPKLMRAAPAEAVTLGLRPHELRLSRSDPAQVALEGYITLAEVSGSETFIHFAREDLALIAQVPGVHKFSLHERCTLYAAAASFYGFDMHGELLFAPEYRA